MRPSRRLIRRLLVLAVLSAAAVLVGRRFASGGGPGSDFLPSIGGDTWPPVPVKDVRPA